MFSPKHITISEVKVDVPVSHNASVNRTPANIQQQEAEARLTTPNTDRYTSDTIQRSIPQAPAASGNPFSQSPASLLMSSLYSRMTDPLIQLQQRIDRSRQIFIDISDKLAAIYGEKEKDIRDKLSDTFKKLILTPFNLLGQVDTTMSQKEHNKEKKLKDGGLNPEIHLNSKDFSLRHWVYYKMLEFKGEILNLTGRITGFNRRFKKFKKKVITTLDDIDSLFEPSREDENGKL